MTPEALAVLHAASISAPRPWTAEEFTRLLKEASVFLVDAPSGFALGRTVGDEAELLTLAVLPKARRLGLGSKLLDALEMEARHRGARQVFLEVSVENTAAKALYAKVGYRKVGHRKDYVTGADGQKCDALVLRKDLLPKQQPDDPISTDRAPKG